MVNKVLLIGNLGRDVELKHLEGNIAVARVSIATNESYKDKKGDWQQKAEWHDLVFWREQAERAEKTLKKGSTVWVEGKLTHRKYTDKDGIERYATDVVVSYFRSLDKKEGGGPSDFPSADDAPGTRTSTESSQGAGEGGSGYDDLPF